MIVRNEARIIRRCLERARALIDYVLIVDTGSTDDTIAESKKYFAETGLVGEVLEDPWRDFAHNRSSALAHLRRRRPDIDYALMIDADDDLHIPAGVDIAALKAGLHADVYDLVTQMGAYSYLRPQLISNKKPFYFRGVLHEFLTADVPFSKALLPHVSTRAVQDSARNQLADKFRRDAATLEAALRDEKDPMMRARYTFYLAQSWRDCGEQALAKKYYLERAGQGFWDQEIYISLYCAGQLTETLGGPVSEAIDFYLRAYDARPDRAEALHGAARLCRLNQRWQTGYLLARRGVDLAPPPDALFRADWIYTYAMRDEYSIAAYWAGHHDECLAACEKLLATPGLPDLDRPRIEENARLARNALAKS